MSLHTQKNKFYKYFAIWCLNFFVHSCTFSVFLQLLLHDAIFETTVWTWALFGSVSYSEIAFLTRVKFAPIVNWCLLFDDIMLCMHVEVSAQTHSHAVTGVSTYIIIFYNFFYNWSTLHYAMKSAIVNQPSRLVPNSRTSVVQLLLTRLVHSALCYETGYW